jgi:hypothetical protein
MNSVLTGKEKTAIIAGIQAQGGTVRELGNGMYRVLSPDSTTQFTMSLNSPSGVVVARDRSRIRKMGLVWPLDPDYEKPKASKPTPAPQTLTPKQTLINSLTTTAKYLFANSKIGPATIDMAVEQGVEMGLSQIDSNRIVLAVARELELQHPEWVAPPEPPVVADPPKPKAEPMKGPLSAVQYSPVKSDVIEEWIDLTPELAKSYLIHNVNNRSVREGHMEALARDMAAGRWRVTGDSIKFDTNNELVDGQHRLLAVVKSNVTIRVLLVLGVEPDVRPVIDGQATRSAGDVLAIRSGGEKNISTLAAAARIALARENGSWATVGNTRSQVFSNVEIVDWLDQHPLMQQAVDLAVSTSRFIFVPTSAWAYCLYLFWQIDEKATKQFAADLAALHTDGSGDPRHTMIYMFQRARADRRRINRADSIYYIIRAWNAWRQGERLSKFAPTAGSVIPDPV